MQKITVKSFNRKGEPVYKSVDLERFVEAVRRSDDNVSEFPQVCFAAQWSKRGGSVKLKEYNALVLLEADNLPDRKTAERVREQASRVPYTLLAYVGVTGREVKIVCRIRSYDDEPLTSVEDIRHFHVNGYARLHRIYSDDLQMTPENREPALDLYCNTGLDSDVYYNAEAQPMFVSRNERSAQQTDGVADSGNGVVMLPGMNRHQSEAMAFETCLAKAQDALRMAEYEAEHEVHTFLSLLADKCCRCGLPKAVVMQMCRHKRWYRENAMIADTVFDNAYAEREIPFTPEKALNKSQLMMLKTKHFLHSRYELRRNVITKDLQFRNRGAYFYDWRNLTDEHLKEMTCSAIENGIELWDRDIDRYLNSSRIQNFDPVQDWIFSLPEWDGVDRVGSLVNCIPSDDETWKPFMRTWLRSMVAHWLGKDPLHGNALMPVLIGYQGCGKTTFCSMLLPKEMRAYYTDRVDMKNNTTIQLALSRYALVNIDEFDQIKKGQQPFLKFIISSADAKMRLPFRSSIEERRRYASFIATTNNQQPLVDTSGSRRFLCIRVTSAIRHTGNLDRAQLFAQLLREVNSGERYWLNEEETSALEAHNSRFMRREGLHDIILSLFRPAKADEACRPLTTTEVMSIIKEHLPNFKQDEMKANSVGRILTDMGTKDRRRSDGFVYRVIPKQTA